MIQRLLLLNLVMSALLLGGCASHTPQSYIANDLEANHIAIIASDMSQAISTYYPDKDTPFKVGNDTFGMYLAQELQKNGYPILQTQPNRKEQKGMGLQITYTIDWLDAKKVYISLDIGDQQRISKIYSVDNANTFPSQQLLIGRAEQ